MNSPMPLTKQGVRNLNSMGKLGKKKPAEAGTAEPEVIPAEPAKVPDKVSPDKDATDKDAVPAT